MKPSAPRYRARSLADGIGDTAGLPPGALVHVGERRAAETRITLLRYGPDGGLDEAPVACADCRPPEPDAEGVAWYYVVGLHDVAALESLGVAFGLHPLVLEDILNTTQRPKVQDLGAYLFVELQSLSLGASTMTTVQEQVSLILGPGYVISFRETEEGDIFEPVRARLGNGGARLHRAGADYLLYALIDTIVDRYFTVLEGLGEGIEDLEEELTVNPEPGVLGEIRGLKQEMLVLRRAVWPLREIVDHLARRDSALVASETELYFRDVYDHVIQLMDTVEILRDVLSGMLDIYLSSISYRLNEVMKVLTIISTLFIPLTFVVGVYGMNFRYMPELGSRWGYPAVWAVLMVIAALMMAYFRRKRWL